MAMHTKFTHSVADNCNFIVTVHDVVDVYHMLYVIHTSYLGKSRQFVKCTGYYIVLNASNLKYTHKYLVV